MERTEKKLTKALGRLKLRDKRKARKREDEEDEEEIETIVHDPQLLTELQQNIEPQLKELYKEKNVLQWYCHGCKKPCLQIREESRCICGHRFKYHKKDSKGRYRCTERCGGSNCPCKNFFYLVAEGSWMLRCQCKHKGIDHDPNTHACKRQNCSCAKFKSPWVCNCNCPWHMHEQIEATIKVKTFAVDQNEFSEINPWQDLKRGLD